MDNKNQTNIYIPRNIALKSIYYYTYTSAFSQQKYIKEIIANILNYIKDPNNRNNLDKIEIEARLGEFEFTGERIQLYREITDTFLIPNFNEKKCNFHFKPGIKPELFFLILSFFENEAKKDKDIKYKGVYIYNEKHYKSGKRFSSVIMNGKEERTEVIIKLDKKMFNVRNNRKDFRISVCKEMPTSIEPNDVIEIKRQKYRIAYDFNFFEFDFTITKEDNKDNYTYEVEIEFTKLKDELKYFPNIDENNLERILNRFIENVINLYTCFYFEPINDLKKYEENLKGIKINNIFGNYCKNNLNK